MKFYIKTYGCQMNLRDSDSAAALLIEHGWTPADGEADADLVILNTCSVRDQAERKAVGKLGFLGKLKRERPWMIFGIMGCMAQNRGAELL
ncbi:MAG: tRNA (N6-isopentenyl adenosine(37)-C2)-methylthiotransferase MiaB, partial [Lentisphaeria bacterium]|nr:tRNA (N6-isopentenyl adenosine(37)-C2)-methylthiotransferase MiaB [Lentisphaeria bacterium]